MKYHKFKFINAFLALLLSFNYALPTYGESETVLENIKKTGLLKVGIRSDAIPFGYRDKNQELKGICLDFFALLRDELKEKIGRDIITIKILISTLSSRFEIVEDNLVYLECGPNTIRDLPQYKVDFSNPFFITGAKLLIKKELEETFKNEQNLSELKIGILRYTSTEQFIKNEYPNVQIKFFQGVKGRLRAIQAVEQKKNRWFC